MSGRRVVPQVAVDQGVPLARLCHRDARYGKGDGSHGNCLRFHDFKPLLRETEGTAPKSNKHVDQIVSNIVPIETLKSLIHLMYKAFILQDLWQLTISNPLHEIVTISRCLVFEIVANLKSLPGNS
jgi:hypothetical protein